MLDDLLVVVGLCRWSRTFPTADSPVSASSAYGLGRVGRWNRHTQKDKLELSKAGAAWSAELLLAGGHDG